MVSANTTGYSVQTISTGEGVGIVGVSSTPDLSASIVGLRKTGNDGLGGFYRALTSEQTARKTGYVSAPSEGLNLISSANPDLHATVFSSPLVEIYSSDLRGYYAPVLSGSTHSFNILVGSEYQGISIVAQFNTPDLKAAWQGERQYLDLAGYYKSTIQTTEDLTAFYRRGFSESETLNAELVGLNTVPLNAFVRTAISSSLDLSTALFAIGPEDLDAQILGVVYEDLFSEITSKDPVDLISSISGQPALGLNAKLQASDVIQLTAEVSGSYVTNLLAHVAQKTSTSAALFGFWQGVVGSDYGDLGASIRDGFTDSSNISGSIFGQYSTDLRSTIFFSNPSEEDLISSISGIELDSLLIASVSGSGSFENLDAYIIANSRQSNSLVSNYIGQGAESLSALIDLPTSDFLLGSFTAVGPIGNFEIVASISGNYGESLEAQYLSSSGGLLGASVNANPGAALSARVRPKVVYIDSSIPITTFYTQGLSASINSDACLPKKGLNDLRVSLSGVLGSDLKSEIFGLQGQLVIAGDLINIPTKYKTIFQDWVFFIADQPAFNLNTTTIVITNSPLSDLSAAIQGVTHTFDLTASVDPVYFSSAPGQPSTLGEWVNLKTGERKVIRFYFKGKPGSFYFSGEASETVTENSSSKLELVVETYDKSEESDDDLLLAIKTSTRTASIDLLDGFSSIDEAVKYGIVKALFELQSPLGAYIKGVGTSEALPASVSVIDNFRSRALKADYVSVKNQPVLSSTITAAGEFADLDSYIRAISLSFTNSIFTDIHGNQYISKLVYNPDGSHSVVLTRIYPEDNIVIQTPDLRAEISGIALTDLSATVSGI